MPNFSQFVRIWHYFTFEIQLFQFTSVPFLKVKPVLVIFPISRMVFWLISLVVIVHCRHMIKPWDAGNCTVFKDPKIKHFLWGNAQNHLQRAPLVNILGLHPWSSIVIIDQSPSLIIWVSGDPFWVECVAKYDMGIVLPIETQQSKKKLNIPPAKFL